MLLLLGHPFMLKYLKYVIKNLAVRTQKWCVECSFQLRACCTRSHDNTSCFYQEWDKVKTTFFSVVETDLNAFRFSNFLINIYRCNTFLSFTS